jgi:hypothetical protein
MSYFKITYSFLPCDSPSLYFAFVSFHTLQTNQWKINDTIGLYNNEDDEIPLTSIKILSNQHVNDNEIILSNHIQLLNLPSKIILKPITSIENKKKCKIFIWNHKLNREQRLKNNNIQTFNISEQKIDTTLKLSLSSLCIRIFQNLLLYTGSFYCMEINKKYYLIEIIRGGLIEKDTKIYVQWGKHEKIENKFSGNNKRYHKR